MRSGKRIRRYVCYVDRGGCGGVGIAADGVEDLVARLALDWLEARPIPAPAPPSGRSELVAVEQRMTELAEMWAAGEIGRAEWAAARRSLEARLEDLVTAVVEPPSFVGRDVRAEWAVADLDMRRSLISAAVERVVIAPSAGGKGRFDPGRVSVEWTA